MNMTDPSLEFGLPAAIFIPFSGVPEDQPDRIDREERLVKTIQNLERDHDAVRRNLLYISSLKKDEILKEGWSPAKRDPRITAAKREIIEAETQKVLASLNAPAEPGKTLADYDTNPDDLPESPRPELDLDVEMDDAGEPIEESVQRMIREATPASKKAILDDYNDKTSPKLRERHAQEEFDPIDAFYRNQVMERLRSETEFKAAQKAMKDLKLSEWNSPCHKLTRLVEVTVEELERYSENPRAQFYQEALERERAKNGSTPIRFERPLAAAPPPITTFHTPTPKPLLAPAPPVDNSRQHNGNGIVSNQFPPMGAHNEGAWYPGAPMMFAHQNGPPRDSFLDELTADEQWLIHLKEGLRLPWKDIAKRYPERSTKSKNEAALQMQYKRLRDKRQEKMQAVGVFPGAQMNGPGYVHPGSIQPTEHPVHGNAPHWANATPPTNIIGAQPPVQSMPNGAGWTAINQQQPLQLPSESLPPIRAEPSATTSYQYQPPPKSSLAPDHPNMAKLDKFLEHLPILGGPVDMWFIAMKTVPVTTNKILALRQGEEFHVQRFIGGKFFQARNAKGFIAKVSEDVLWGDIVPGEAGNQIQSKPAWSAYYKPPPITWEHPNYTIFKMLNEKPLGAGQTMDVNFVAMKSVPHSGTPKNNGVLALSVGAKLTLVKYLQGNEFHARNIKGHTALITDEVIWGGGLDAKPKVPDSFLEKQSSQLLQSENSAPTGPKNPSLDRSILDTYRQQYLLNPEPGRSEQNHNQIPPQGNIPVTTNHNTYDLPPYLRPNHPNQKFYEFLRSQPPLEEGTKIYRDVIAIKQVKHRTQNSIRFINAGDTFRITKYFQNRKFLCEKGGLGEFEVDEEVVWGEPDAPVESRNGSGNMEASNGGVGNWEKVQADFQSTSRVSNTTEVSRSSIAPRTQDVSSVPPVTSNVSIHPESVPDTDPQPAPGQNERNNRIPLETSTEMSNRAPGQPLSSNHDQPPRTAAEVASSTTLGQIASPRPVGPTTAATIPEGPAGQIPNPKQNARNIEFILTRRWEPQEAIGVNFTAPFTTTTLAGFRIEKGDVIRVLRYESGEDWPAKNLTTGFEGTITREFISTLTDADLVTANAKNLAILDRRTSKDWQTIPREKLELEFVALQKVPPGNRKLALEKGDGVIILDRLGDFTYLARNRRTGQEGNLWDGILRNPVLLFPSTERVLSTERISSTEKSSRDRSVAVETQSEKLARIFAKKWKPCETFTKINLIAQKDVIRKPGVLGIRKGDVVELSMCVTGMCFSGRNQQTGVIGEVEIDVFLDEDIHEQGERRGSKRSRGNSLERARESDWQSRDEEIRATREKERADSHEQGERRGGKRSRGNSLERSREWDWQSRDEEIRATREKERAERQKKDDYERERRLREAREREAEERKQKELEYARQKEREEREREDREVERARVERVRVEEERVERERVERERVEKEEVERERVEREREERERVERERVEREREEREREERERVERERVDREREEREREERERVERERVERERVEKEREKKEREDKEREEREREAREREEREQKEIERKKLEAAEQKEFLERQKELRVRQKELEEDLEKTRRRAQKKRGHEVAGQRDSTEQRQHEEEERQRQRRVEEQLQRQIEEDDQNREQRSIVREGSKELLPNWTPTAPRADRAEQLTELTVDILATGKFRQGETVDFQATATKSLHKENQLRMERGDQIHLVKFISGKNFFAINLRTGKKGEVPYDVFMPRQPVGGRSNGHKSSPSRGSFSSGYSPRKPAIGRYELTDGDTSQNSSFDSPPAAPVRNFEIKGIGRDDRRQQESGGSTNTSPANTLGNYPLSFRDERDGMGRGRRGRGRGRETRGADHYSPVKLGSHHVDESPRRGRGRR